MANWAVVAGLILSAVGCNGCGSRATEARDSSDGARPAASGRVEELRGIDTSSLTRDEKRTLLDVANEELDPCGGPRSLAASLQRGDCRRAPWAVRFVLKLVELDLSASEIGDFYVRRYGAQAVRRLELGASPVKGGEMAAVTLVEFADFECPHCAQTAPAVDELVRRYDGKVRLVFKHFPLSAHEHAEGAARAAVAAHRQGKFWPMHRLLFENQTALTREHLERYAQQVGLDLERFRADLDDAEVARLVQEDRRVGETAGVDSTPTFFVNGRMVEGGLDDIAALVDEELDLR